MPWRSMSRRARAWMAFCARDSTTHSLRAAARSSSCSCSGLSALAGGSGVIAPMKLGPAHAVGKRAREASVPGGGREREPRRLGRGTAERREPAVAREELVPPARLDHAPALDHVDAVG